ARFVPGFAATAPIEGAQGIVGVEGRLVEGGATKAPARIRSRAVVIAAGSNPRLLEAFGVLRRPPHPPGALRGYLPYDPFLDGRADALLISYERALLPGYGWSFPLPGGTWNIGCGILFGNDRRTAREPSRGVETSEFDLRALLATFLRAAPAPVVSRAARVPGDDWWRTVKGAPARTVFTGAAPVRGPVLVGGESLGLTLPLTGDGIGKAMQSGLIAASSLIEALARGGRALDLGAYATTLEARLRHTYGAYEAA